MAKRKHKSSLHRFFENAAEAAEGAAAEVQKAVVPKKKAGAIAGARGAVGSEVARGVFGVIGYLLTSVTSGLAKQAPVLSDYPMVSLAASVGASYLIGALLTKTADYRKAVFLGAIINAGIAVAKEYGGLVAANAQLSGQLAAYSNEPIADYNSFDRGNVTQFGG